MDVGLVLVFVGGLVVVVALILFLDGFLRGKQEQDAHYTPSRSAPSSGGRQRVARRKLDPRSYESENVRWAGTRGEARVSVAGLNPDHEIRPIAPHERGGKMRNAVVINRKTGRPVRYETVDWQAFDTPPKQGWGG